MSYKCLLFCPDERTAGLVTQVLSELEFTVELSNEPYATVKKLAEERFDALVADIQDEQNAGLLFKSARNSSLNHSSLAVAVVEGQSGVAKAFRIGANLVLTKPINIEQSKSTLRVARGLLRKNETKSATAPAAGTRRTVFTETPGPGLPPVKESAPLSPVTPASAPASPASAGAFPALTPVVLTPPASTAAASGFSMLETEKEPAPAPDATEAAVLESMAKPTASKERNRSLAPLWRPTSQTIAPSTAGYGAAVAPARSKPQNEIKFSAPLATHEAIVPADTAVATFVPASAPVPSFSYGQESGSSGNRILIAAAVIVVLGVVGYLGQRLQLGHYLSFIKGSSQSSSSKIEKAPAIPESKPAAPEPTVTLPSPTNDLAAAVANSTPDSNSLGSTHKSQPETIEVKDLPVPEEPKISVVQKPLVVKTSPGASQAGKKQAQVAPPSLALATPESGATQTAMANLVSPNLTVPQPAPHTVRISQGLSQGLVVKKVAPVYPPMALQLRKEGAVELTAIISKEGAITGLKVASGDPVLGKAALDAVRQWKYRPYLLNGEPVDIETQITVHFRLPH